jgi:hypothetical protein
MRHATRSTTVEWTEQPWNEAEGGSLRRKFATEMKATSLKDLCALGGWKDHDTILKCYQQPDAETMRGAGKPR